MKGWSLLEAEAKSAFAGSGRFPLRAYSEFMPPPYVAIKPYAPSMSRALDACTSRMGDERALDITDPRQPIWLYGEPNRWMRFTFDSETGIWSVFDADDGSGRPGVSVNGRDVMFPEDWLRDVDEQLHCNVLLATSMGDDCCMVAGMIDERDRTCGRTKRRLGLGD